MSRTTVNLYSALDSLIIECQDDEPVIWIRSDEVIVSLTLSKAGRDALMKALDDADTYDGNTSDADDDLIGAAPELLEAISLFIEFDDAGEPPGDICFEKARAAYAKATGENHG